MNKPGSHGEESGGNNESAGLRGGRAPVTRKSKQARWLATQALWKFGVVLALAASLAAAAADRKGMNARGKWN